LGQQVVQGDLQALAARLPALLLAAAPQLLAPQQTTPAVATTTLTYAPQAPAPRQTLPQLDSP